jgi:hypothetical protein
MQGPSASGAAAPRILKRGSRVVSDDSEGDASAGSGSDCDSDGGRRQGAGASGRGRGVRPPAAAGSGADSDSSRGVGRSARGAKRRRPDSDPEDPEGHDGHDGQIASAPTAAASVTPAAAAPLAAPSSAAPPAGKELSETESNLGALELLPDDVEMDWFVIVNPELLSTMFSCVEAQHETVAIYVRDFRRVKVVDGKRVVVGFRGVLFDAIDKYNICFSSAALPAVVCINPQKVTLEGGRVTYDLDTLPPPTATPLEEVACVRTKLMAKLLRRTPANNTLALFVEKGTCRLRIATGNNEGRALDRAVNMMETPERHNIIKSLSFTIELSIPLSGIIAALSEAKQFGADIVTLTYREGPHNSVFCLEANGLEGDMRHALPVHAVGESAGAAALREACVVALDADGDTGNDDVAAKAGLRRMSAAQKADPKHKSIRWGIIERMRETYRGSFSLQYLTNIVKPLAPTTQMSIFLNEQTASLPLVMRVGLGRPGSHVSWITAPRV